MQLRIDPTVSYALALEGGGAKGAYQIGAWRALREAGIRISAVAGSSVGAMNGALIVMGDLDKAEDIWRNIRFSKVMDVDDETMLRLIRGDLGELDLRAAGTQLMEVLRNRGFDVAPLRAWMNEVVSEEAVRRSDTELYIVTYSLTEQKELELRASELPPGTLQDMLLASAYLPVFRSEKLGGKRYVDGGLRDVLPLHVLLENGYRDIIALRLFGIGVERPVRVPRTARVHTVQPTQELGGTLEFTPELSRANLRAGYYDAQRFLYGLQGEKLFIDALWTEEEACAFLRERLSSLLAAEERDVTLRELHERLLPAAARALDAGKGDYRALALAFLEALAEEANPERWRIYTEAELAALLPGVPERVRQALPPVKKRRTAPHVRRAALPDGAEELNVCLMNDSFPPVIDGVANAVLNYARHINGRRTVVTPEYPGAVDDYDFPVVRYPSLDTGKLSAGYRAGNPFVPGTIARLGEMGFNVIHSHCPVISTTLARSLREVTNAPVVLTYHTKFDVDIARAVRGERLQNAAIRALVANVSACDEVWVVSRGAGENLRSLGYQGEYIVMPNGVDLPRGRAEDAAVSALNGDWELPAELPVFLFIGRIMWYKGLRLILDALAQYLAGGRDFRMVFLGDGQDRPAVESYCRELGLDSRCHFVGAVRDRETVRAWYTRADLLLFPSTFDTNGLVVREAAACGLGSLLIDGSCAAEGIRDGETGLLIPETAEGLCAALLRWGGDRSALRALGQRAMDGIYLSWEDSVRAACERYHQVIELWRRGELRRRRAPLDGLFNVSGEVVETLESARVQRREAMAQLGQELGRVRDRIERYL